MSELKIERKKKVERVIKEKMNAKEKQKLRHKNNNSHALCGIAIFVENYSAVEKEKPFFSRATCLT